MEQKVITYSEVIIYPHELLYDRTSIIRRFLNGSISWEHAESCQLNMMYALIRASSCHGLEQYLPSIKHIIHHQV